MDTRIVNLDLMEFVERNILPRYNNFDKAHNLNHANLVIKNSLALALSLVPTSIWHMLLPPTTTLGLKDHEPYTTSQAERY